MSKKNELDILISGAGKNSALIEKDRNVAEETKVLAYRQKKLNRVPLNYFDLHEKLKTNGGTTLNFEAYIMESLRTKFKEDGML